MEIISAFIDLAIGAGIAAFFLQNQSKYTIRARGISLQISAVISALIVLFLPALAFMIMGQLMVALFFEIPMIQAAIAGEKENG